ncbi:MAG: ABC transporter ATP-binding protein [Deltaproteobacteria bacterium]|nr:ABC transporter ATP-binding protein [Deltaproteobacteria bacterium]
MLKVESINTFYGKAQIIFDLSFEVSAGEVAVLLGRNGAGKTTTFKSIMGLVPAARGTITFNTENILGWPPHKICGLGLGYVPEDRRIFSKLTIMENLEVGKQPSRGGEQQMLAIARTLMGNPELIILDEPSEGLAPVILEQLAKTIVKLKAEGVAVLMADQNLNFAKTVCDWAYIIQQGRICHESAINELSRETCEKYLSV